MRVYLELSGLQLRILGNVDPGTANDAVFMINTLLLFLSLYSPGTCKESIRKCLNKVYPGIRQ